jgi:hypothetical protein
MVRARGGSPLAVSLFLEGRSVVVTATFSLAKRLFDVCSRSSPS